MCLLFMDKLALGAIVLGIAGEFKLHRNLAAYDFRMRMQRPQKKRGLVGIPRFHKISHATAKAICP
jgi:hypothetical protein